jgi:hypothetical protein
MRGHPANAEKPDTLETAPQDEPYVPFGAGEIIKWTADDLRKLPTGVRLSDPEGWEWLRTLSFNHPLDEILQSLVDWHSKEGVVGFTYASNATAYGATSGAGPEVIRVYGLKR